MYDIFLLLLNLFFFINIVIIYVNVIREDFGKPKLINLLEFYKNIYNYLKEKHQ